MQANVSVGGRRQERKNGEAGGKFLRTAGEDWKAMNDTL